MDKVGGSPKKQPLVCWERAQPIKDGPWQWKEHDQEIALLKKYGFLLMSNLGTGGGCTPNWAESLPKAEKNRYFRQWLKAVVERYGSRGNGAIKHWEMVAEYKGENPSPYQFVEEIKTTYQIMKAADPQAIAWISLAGAATTHQVQDEKRGRRTWVSKILAGTGLEEYTDILVFHHYGLKKDLIKTIKAIDWIVNKPDYNLQGKQAWITEGKDWSPWMEGEPPSEKEEAEELRKRYNIALGKTKIPGVTIKINKVFWSGHLINKNTLEPTPSFCAYKEMAIGIPCISLSSGWNQITWPDAPGYTAKMSLEDVDNDCGVGTGIIIARKRKDFWEEYVKGYGGRNFDLSAGKKYHLNVTRKCSWNP